MGNRATVQFTNKEGDMSPIFYSHWDGETVHKEAKKYVKKLKEEAKLQGTSDPLFRLEPERVILDFMRYYLFEREASSTTKYISSNYALGINYKEEFDAGHLEIKL